MKFTRARIGANMTVAISTLCLVVIMVGAIVYQEFSWWVLPYTLLFGTIFVGILTVCFLSYREERFRRTSVESYADEPWMWDSRWRSDTMTSRSKSEFWGTLAVSIILGMFALLGVATLLEELPKGNLWVLFNLIPIFAAVYFGRNTYVAWKTLRLEEYFSLTNETRPAWIGSRFSALVNTRAGHHPESVGAWLEHFNVIRREEHDGVTFEKVVDHKLPGKVENIAHDRARITVDIPRRSPATSWLEHEQNRWWDLVISADVFGKEVTLRYEIPVADPENTNFAKHNGSKVLD